MSIFQNIKRTVRSTITGVKYCKYTTNEYANLLNAENYIDMLIDANNDIVARSMELDNYKHIIDDSGVTEYMLANKVYKAIDKRNNIYNTAIEHFVDVLNIEKNNIETAMTDLINIAKERYDKLGLIEPEHINVQELIYSGFYFEGDPNKVFENIKNDTILNNKEIKDDALRAFYKYNNGLILSDIYAGLADLAMTIYQYVEYKELGIDDYSRDYSDIPIKRNTLAWMPDINKGAVYAIPKRLVDRLFNDEDEQYKELKAECFKNILEKDDKSNVEVARNEIELHKIFLDQTGYLKQRPAMSRFSNSLGDDGKVLMSAVDITTLLEYGYDIESLRKDVSEIICYMVDVIGSVPENFESSAIISSLLPEDIVVDRLDVNDTDGGMED